jgi:hypothetical protein
MKSNCARAKRRKNCLVFANSAILAVICLFAGATSARTQGRTANANASSYESDRAAQVRALNNSVLQLHGQVQRDSSAAASLANDAATVLAQRAAALQSLIQENPRAALSFAFSPDLLADLAAKFPNSASSLESHTTVTGPLEHWVEDGANLKTSRSYFLMKVGKQTLTLHFAGPEPAVKPGEQAQVTGVIVASEMAVEKTSTVPSSSSSTATFASVLTALLTAGNLTREWPCPIIALFIFAFALVVISRALVLRNAPRQFKRFTVCAIAIAFAVLGSNPSITAAQTSACTTSGVQNVAVLLVTFPGATLPTSVTPQSLDDIFFNTSTGASLDGFLRDASYGRTSANGAVFGPYTLTGSYPSCGVAGVLDDALTAAVSSGVSLANYNRIFLVFPDTLGCGWAGFVSSGCSIASSSGTLNASIAYMAAYYLNTRSDGVSLTSHEMGHNLGLLHSGTISSGTNVLGPVASPGSVTDMGDYWATMGEMVLGLYPAPQKSETLGWMLPSSNYQTVQTSGTYTLQPLETSPAGLQALKVQRGIGNNAWLWVEYRQPLGSYDSTLLPQPFSGALIHYEDSTTAPGHTYLLNFNPTDLTGNSPALGAGQTWTDPYSNVSISVLSATAAGLTVSVSYGATPCTPSSPSVVVSPPNPNIYPGQSANYSLSVTNNDSAGCSSATVDLASSEPSGWSTSLSSSSVTLAPGQSTSVMMGKGAPSGTLPGTYAVNVNAAKSSFTTSETANATVITSHMLAASISVPAQSFTPPGSVSITASVTNGASPASGAYVTFTISIPTGATVTQTVTTGTGGNATWNYKLNQRSQVGTYLVTAQAALSSGSKKSTSTQSATSNTVIFSVQ